MPYELLWRSADADRWIDHLPSRFFAESQHESLHSHRCTKAGSGSLIAYCVLSSTEDYLDIYYPEQEPDVYPGTTRIPTQDGRPRSEAEIGWADPGAESFAWDHAEWGESPILRETAEDVEDRYEREALATVRRGQNEFRRSLDQIWSSACALTGITQRDALRASHITPWRKAEGRLDPDNGLLLAAHVDALFDRRLITFDSSGGLHWSPEVSPADRVKLALPTRLAKEPTLGQEHFLRQHRVSCSWFQGDES